MKAVEIREVASLDELADEVQRTQQPCVLQRNGVDVAVLTPVSDDTIGKGRKSKEAIEAFRRAAGSWAGLIDADKFLEENYAQRRRSSRPRVDL